MNDIDGYCIDSNKKINYIKDCFVTSYLCVKKYSNIIVFREQLYISASS